MKLIYLDVRSIDCTADPHYVSYDALEAALHDILKTCESSLVSNITCVYLDLGTDKETISYESDYYDTPWKPEQKPTQSETAERNKVNGLAFVIDHSGSNKNHLAPGLGGVKQAIKIIRKYKENLPRPTILKIGVVWKFRGQHDCSDYITLEYPELQVDYSNQDWSIGEDGYAEHCQALSELLNVHIEPSD